MANLLFVCHCPSENTRRLRDAALTGIAQLAPDNLTVRALSPLEASAEDIEWCDGILIGTTENLGYMAGLIKDFFERIYYPCLESSQGLPVALYIRAGQDGRGTQTSIGRITTGLRWKTVSEPLILRGEWDDAFDEQVAELAMTLAAGLDTGIY
ncbi:MAG: flavodoxin family protein [Woeseiaceae bacterium]|nr:flavodoxin family protein [Woeseiaceae bacterium]